MIQPVLNQFSTGTDFTQTLAVTSLYVEHRGGVAWGLWEGNGAEDGGKGRGAERQFLVGSF